MKKSKRRLNDYDVVVEKQTRPASKTQPLLEVRLRVWDYTTRRYEMFDRNRRWSEVASLAATRWYAAGNGYDDIRITPM